MTTRTLSLAVSFTVALLLALPLTAFAGSIRLAAHLHPTHHEPDASGAVLFESRHGHHQKPLRRLAVGVESVTSTDLVAVLVNGHFLDFIELDHAGTGGLHLSSAHGHDVPALHAGDVVQVVDAYDGHTILLEGTLSGVHHP